MRHPLPSGGEIPLPGPLYFPVELLTQRPQALSVGDLESAETAALIVSGKIVLQVWIDQSGQVADVVVESSGLPKAFAKAARAAFLNAQFVPGEREGTPVGSVLRIEVSYEDERLPQPPGAGVGTPATAPH